MIVKNYIIYPLTHLKTFTLDHVNIFDKYLHSSSQINEKNSDHVKCNTHDLYTSYNTTIDTYMHNTNNN
jgi:hypothetical protein